MRLKINEFYGTVVAAGVHVAPSIKAAESARVIEDLQRDFNLALMNEANVPDIRNSRVIDIVRELGRFGVSWRSPIQCAGQRMSFTNNVTWSLGPESIEMLAPADLIVLAVPHHAYIDAGWQF